jgi:hypothetical protein
MYIGFMYDEESRPISVPIAGILQGLSQLTPSLYPVPPLRTESVALSIIKAIESVKNDNLIETDTDTASDTRNANNSPNIYDFAEIYSLSQSK